MAWKSSDAVIKTIHIPPASRALVYLLPDRLKRLEALGFEAIGFSSDDRYGADFRDLGFQFIGSRRLTREVNFISDMKFFFECVAVFMKEKPAVVNTYGLKPGLYARIAARLTGVPAVVHTSWGMYFEDTTAMLKKLPVLFAEKLAARFCDYIFSENKEDLELMRRYRFKSKQRLGLLGNGADIRTAFNPRRFEHPDKAASRKDRGEKLVIGSVGRLTKSKGFPELFDVAKALKEKYPNVSFSIVGIPDDIRSDGIPKAEIEALAEDGTIRFVEPMPNRDMPDYYRSVDILVLPSHREGFPKALVEAAAMALPIVATDVRGCREVVDHTVNGILVPKGDKSALFQALEKLVTNRDLRLEMGENGRRKAEAEFDEDVIVNRIAAVYESILENKTNPARTKQTRFTNRPDFGFFRSIF